ncbi:MAG: M48 family metalloprotease [Deltaproteobacteria bacterium]|jgi:Zn-dependent protease with chaperone function|nr:M48 family metalloprotease [Deltaproteobacteria bacterium]
MLEPNPTAFFQRQEENRRRSWVLFVLFGLIFGLWHWSLYYGFDYCLRLFNRTQNPSANNIYFTNSLALKTSILPTLAVAISSLTASLQALLALGRGGGSYVATALGGIPLGETESVLGTPAGVAQEKILRHVVSEMSLAAGLTPPDIYILPQARAINALTSGLGQDDAALVLTRGALTRLSRDELAGLVAHELSHLQNGDTRLNSLMAGGLKGFFILTKIGLALPPVSLIFLVVGAVGYLSGRLLQAAFSRRREFLADAGATQFTRAPQSLARVLIKVGALGEKGLSRVNRGGVALEYQHLCLVEPGLGLWPGLFKAHPPLTERIWALWPQWDGTWPDLAANPTDNLQESLASRD